MRKQLFVAAILLLLFPMFSFGITVESIQCGLGVKKKTIVKSLDSFKVGDRVWCLSVLTDVKKPTYVIHRWILNDRHFDVKLKVKPYKKFRTWSYKTIYPSMKGVWKLEVLDKDGNLLREKVFTVK